MRVKEAVVAASDRPDEAFEWLSEVWNEGTTEEMLRDPSGFTTLDAKIHSAITNVLEGDFARQMDTFKEREGHEGRYVRGRQILWKLDGYLATNALHGSVYDMEDLLNVVMVNDNLVQFIRNWDTVLSGIKKTPSDDVLESLFHRQIKKNKALAHDVAIYERAVDGTPEKTFEFLYKAANRHINAKRLEKNRDRMAKQAAAGMPSAPAPLKRVPRGFCVDFVKKGSCSKDNCPYKHEKPEKSRGRTPSGGKGKGRGRSPSGRGAHLRTVRRSNASSSSKAVATKEMRAGSFTISLPLRPLAVGESQAVKRERRRIRRIRGARNPDPAPKARKVAEVPKEARAPVAVRARVRGGAVRSLRFLPPFVF